MGVVRGDALARRGVRSAAAAGQTRGLPLRGRRAAPLLPCCRQVLAMRADGRERTARPLPLWIRVGVTSAGASASSAWWGGARYIAPVRRWRPRRAGAPSAVISDRVAQRRRSLVRCAVGPADGVKRAAALPGCAGASGAAIGGSRRTDTRSASTDRPAGRTAFVCRFLSPRRPRCHATARNTGDRRMSPRLADGTPQATALR